MSLTCNISNLYLLYYPLNPYLIVNANSLTGLVADFYTSLISVCCADASGIMYQNLMFPNMTTMLFAYQSMFASSAVAMPVFSIYSASSVPAPSNYVQVLVLPAFVQLAPPKSDEVAAVIQSAFSVWPILVTIWGFTGIVAYILWFVENYRSKDKSPFARTFGRGVMDSFWNSFITAGTIGYGDMVVKSQLGRFVIVLWITLSILMFSVLTGTFTSLLTAAQASTSSFPSITGSAVGVLYNSVEKNLVVSSGGTPVEMSDLPALAVGVSSGKVSTALVNMFTYLAQYDNASASLFSLRQQVTSQFSASVGLIFGNSFSSTFPAALFPCLQQQSNTNQLLFSGQWSKVSETLNQKVAASSSSSTSLSLEHLIAICSVAFPLLLTSITFTIYRFVLEKHRTVQPQQQSGKQPAPIKLDAHIAEQPALDSKSFAFASGSFSK